MSGYMSSDKPFPLLANAMLLGIICSSYNILILLMTFPEKENISKWTTAHVMTVNLISDLIGNFEYVTSFSILLQCADKRISGIHVTALAAMSNMTSFLHKFYIFKLIDWFGIFYPQAVIGALSLAIWVVFRPTFVGLQDRPLEAWHISDSVLAVDSSEKSKKDKNV